LVEPLNYRIRFADKLAELSLNGTFHAFDRHVCINKYVFGDGIEWSQPVVVDLPFKVPNPELLADKAGFIHAVWLDYSNVLSYSSVRATDFASSSSWTPRIKLAESVFDFSITLDQNDDLHLSYLSPVESTEFPAGIYYLKLITGNNAWTWTSPVLIYSSPYFRSLELNDPSVELETSPIDYAVVDIATSTIDGVVHVYAAWDNSQRERVYLAISSDGGQTWALLRKLINRILVWIMTVRGRY
jgi:hypothetical protein